MKNAWILVFACTAITVTGCNAPLQRNMPNTYSAGPRDVVSDRIENPEFLLVNRMSQVPHAAYQGGGARSQGLEDSVFSAIITRPEDGRHAAGEESNDAGVQNPATEGSEARRVQQLSRLHALTAYDVLAGGAIKAGGFFAVETPQFAANRAR